VRTSANEPQLVNFRVTYETPDVCLAMEETTESNRTTFAATIGNCSLCSEHVPTHPTCHNEGYRLCLDRSIPSQEGRNDLIGVDWKPDERSALMGKYCEECDG
jgi:hypothetical protein